ncbi:MAG: hypothetical protein LBH20_04595 [Treponema sp.]|jgi:hypothetical protein|nr:hypothetical protein [Treponema sp.]
MANITWPDELPPTLLLNGLSAQPQNDVIRTAMDSGPKKARRRYTAYSTGFSGKIILSAAQLAIFRRFYHTALADGVLRFNFTDPFTLEAAEFRFTAAYSAAALDGLFEITMPLERMS